MLSAVVDLLSTRTRLQSRPRERRGKSGTRPALGPMQVAAMFLLLGSGLASAQPGANTCTNLIQSGKSLVATDPTRAIEVLAEAVSVCEASQLASARDQEVLRWRLANLTLTQTEQQANRCQQFALGSLAVNYWDEYIRWYMHLTPDERKTLPIARIQTAVQLLEAAVQDRGQPGSCSGGAEGIRQLFYFMVDLPYSYLSARAVRVWKDWLWRCPTWMPTEDRSYQEVHQSVCGSTVASCSEEWRAYRTYLRAWLEERSTWKREGREFEPGKDLSPSSIAEFSDELQSLDSALACEADD